MTDRRQLRRISAALADFYAPGMLLENYVDRAFVLTSRLVPLVLNTIGILENASRQLQANFDHDPPGLQRAFAAFGALMHKYQPTRLDAATNGGRPFSLRDFYSGPALRDLDIYQEVYRPMGFQDHCFVHIRTDPGTTVFLGLFRDQGAFDENEKGILEILQPHLSNARHLAAAASAASESCLSPEMFGREGFTTRECDVIYWLAQGKSNEEIATILRIRTDSVSRNLQSIYTKMGVDHRVGAALYAISLSKRLHAETVLGKGGAVNLRVRTRKHRSRPGL